MTEAIIVAALSLIGTLCGTYFSNRKTSALIAYRIEKLEEKVNKHNNVIERTYNLEKRVEVDERELEHTNERIAKLEGFHE